jgi:hypothetical protein
MPRPRGRRRAPRDHLVAAAVAATVVCVLAWQPATVSGQARPGRALARAPTLSQLLLSLLSLLLLHCLETRSCVGLIPRSGVCGRRGGWSSSFFQRHTLPCHATTLCVATVTFAPGVDLPNTAAGARAVYAVDLDADGDVDVLHASNGDDVVGGVVGARPLGFQESLVVRCHARQIGIVNPVTPPPPPPFSPPRAHTVRSASMCVGHAAVLMDLARGVHAATLSGPTDSNGSFRVPSCSMQVAWWESNGAASPAFTWRLIKSAAQGVQSVIATGACVWVLVASSGTCRRALGGVRSWGDALLLRPQDGTTGLL